MKLTPYFVFSANTDSVYSESIFEQRSAKSALRAGSYYTLPPDKLIEAAKKC